MSEGESILHKPKLSAAARERLAGPDRPKLKLSLSPAQHQLLRRMLRDAKPVVLPVRPSDLQDEAQ